MEVASLEDTVVIVGSTAEVQTQTATIRGSVVGGIAGGVAGGIAGGLPEAPPFRAPRPWRYPSGPYNTTTFDKIDENTFLGAAENPLSTFSVDVDTASYAFIRRMLTTGTLPETDAVRIEEMLNYFRYDYPNPKGEAPFSVTTDVVPCPWNTKHMLAHIGLQARRLDSREMPPRNLVFLLDVSGSMEPPDKLPLVRSAMKMLVSGLTSRDTVAIAVYAGSSGVVLQPTRGSEKDTIIAAIDHLHAGGSTNGAEGLQTAYRLARQHLNPEGVNRILLATDGDFNTGITSRSEVVRMVEEQRKAGIGLSVFGVGADNLMDATLVQLADRGNGNYSYLDTLEEAHKVLMREAGATIVTVASDVKIQAEFNPAQVAAYRLIGYEKRALKAEDFRDDTKDAGEIGAGHSVTALYEIIPPGIEGEGPAVDQLRYQKPRPLSPEARGNELMWVKLRYKLPGQDASIPLDVVVDAPRPGELRMTPNAGFAAAVAAFGMMLRDSQFKGATTWKMAAQLGEKYRGDDADGYRAQLVRLVEMAESLSRTRPKTR
jgi:Ca-activated chloride channel family protein